MAQPYVGEIRMFAGNFAPAGWMFCEGQLLPISENETLFTIIGTTYGGDGESTFALPDLRGRLPLHQGNGFILAETGGAEEITLTVNQIPAHSHVALATSSNGDQPSPIGGRWAANAVVKPYNVNPASVNMGGNPMSPTGGSQPHTNFQPYLCIDFILSLFGIFPSPNSGGGSAEPFLSELRIFSFDFAPGGWAQCNGQLLPINQNQALFSLLGTTFGGDGRTTFALPDLRGRAIVGNGQGPGLSSYALGQRGGSESVTLAETQLPAHAHAISGTMSAVANCA